MRRLGLLVVTAAFAAIALNVGLQPAGASAASCLYINKIYYDSPGADTGSNASLNDEWIRLKSSCTTSKSLANFKVRDGSGKTYTFGAFTLAPGATVKIHSGNGTNTASNRYWGRTTYVWGNTKDSARLYDASAYVIHTCSYNNSSVNAKTCPAGTYL